MSNDVKVDHLIEKIKQEGIEEARQKADEILQNAQAQARDIVEQARKEAEALLANAQKQQTALQENGKAALQASARDVELLLKERILALFNSVFQQEIAKTLTPDFLPDLILSIVNQWRPETQIQITVNQADHRALEDLLFRALNEKAKSSITLKINNRVTKGFRIELKEDQACYDFTDEAISEALNTFLSPRLRSILTTQDG